MEHFLLSDTEKEELKQFIGAEAELPDMLNARERRVWVQEKLLTEYSGVLVSFTLNIPGPVKVLPYVPEAFLCVDADALDVKRLLVPLEDASKLGRLYDIDIIGRDGKKISRSDIGKPGRTCLLCGRPARECSRSRTHSVAELTAAIEKIFKENIETADSTVTAFDISDGAVVRKEPQQ